MNALARDTLTDSGADGTREEKQLVRRIRVATWLFILGLVVSGATAIPLEWELRQLAEWFGFERQPVVVAGGEASGWLSTVHEALQDTSRKHPVLFYGTDWLAFGHFVIAIAFVGALRDPLRNRWLFSFGMIACALVIPYAMIFGSLRGIPFWWRLVDCAFGIIGFVPLWFGWRWTNVLEFRTPDDPCIPSAARKTRSAALRD